ncbi:MAG TPA: hypothetical protein VJY35_06725, partial [Candidatus Eisenbacteria bacterium]|nr:hypothetical protein [Candidatus Eisenbacteria bacterium]
MSPPAEHPRRLLACDACGAGAWIGPRPPGAGAAWDAWCEGCQSRHPLAEIPGVSPACPRCGVTVTLGEPRFEELPGAAQQIVAVLAAWCGDPAPLAALLPDRPLLLTDHEPPAVAPDDPATVRAGLEALAAGQFARAKDALADATRSGVAAARVWRALGIAAEHLG